MNHQHTCACGSVLTCHMERDKCAVPASGQWDCPTCLDRQRQEYFEQFAELRERRAALKATTATTPHVKHA